MSKYSLVRFIVTIVVLTGAWQSQANAQKISGTPVEHIVAPGGKVVYYITSVPSSNSVSQPTLKIEAGTNENRSFEILLISHHSNDPKQNLDGFSKLSLSPDGKTLYFQTSAWATSNAIHSLDIATKKESYVTAAQIACIILTGQYQGDLIVQQHRYYVQGGSYYDFYLFEPTGNEVGLVSQDGDASKVCLSLGG